MTSILVVTKNIVVSSWRVYSSNTANLLKGSKVNKFRTRKRIHVRQRMKYNLQNTYLSLMEIRMIDRIVSGKTKKQRGKRRKKMKSNVNFAKCETFKVRVRQVGWISGRLQIQFIEHRRHVYETVRNVWKEERWTK